MMARRFHNFNSIRRPVALAVLFRRGFCALALAAGLMLGHGASAQEFKSGTLTIKAPWTRATPGGAKVAGGYMTITNNGSESDRLVGGTFPGAARVEIHEMKMDGGVMQMRPLTNGLEIKAGETIKLEPGGFHAMFVGMSTQLKPGDKPRGQLRFEKAGTIEVDYAVAPVGASQPPAHGH
jgi:periplasmic copper chaperone A